MEPQMYSNDRDKFKTYLLKSELDRARKLGKAVNIEELTAFDMANIECVNQYKDAVELAVFKDQMKRICELAGINHELEKQRWWSKYHQQKDKRDEG